jgi:hypothetical protein
MRSQNEPDHNSPEVPSESYQSFGKKPERNAQEGPSKASPRLEKGSKDDLQEKPSPQDSTETPAIKKKVERENDRTRRTKTTNF